MQFERQPTLPDAHQQIRLGDCQSAAKKWTSAINFYRQAINYFQTIRNSLDEQNLISIIDVQIEQCEKTIYLCQLKDRVEQMAKAQQAERSSKITRAHSISNFKESAKPHRPLTRHNTLRLENTFTLGGHTGTDSFAAFVFSKNENRILIPKAKKHEKHDAEKLEELRMSNEALKAHLKDVVDRAQKLEQENDRLRNQRGLSATQSEPRSAAMPGHQEDENEDENELEQTL